MGQWGHHEDISANSLVGVIKAHEKLHQSIFFSLIIMRFHLIASGSVRYISNSFQRLLIFV